MPDAPAKFFLTTPIYYVNARPHIGHAYTTIVADVLARRHRLLGEDTFFLTGTDEHGQKIERSALAAGVAPQEFADRISAEFRGLWDRMGLTYDRFIRTTDEAHKRGVQKLFGELQDRGQIYLDSYTGQYCVSEEMFVEGPPGTIGPDGRPTETVTEENYFFRLSAFGEPILALIESGQMEIQPEARRNEVVSFLRGGLKDLSISRSSFTWGVPVPGDERHVIYVWLDALANYMTALGYGSEDETLWKKYWPADLHIVGKEIIRFHCVYWPAFLLAAGLPLPKKIVAHGWLLFEESKMSKSRGNIVRTETILDGFGDEVYGKQFPESTKRERDLFASDVLRYFLLREIPFGQDGSFSFDAMITRYNADLANGYGNLVSRTLKMIGKYFHDEIPQIPPTQNHSVAELMKSLESLVPTYGAAELTDLAQFFMDCIKTSLAKMDFSGTLKLFQILVSSADQMITSMAPWKVDQSNVEGGTKVAETLYVAAEVIRIYTALFYPVLPFATAAVWRQLGLGEIEEAAKRGELKDLQWGGLRPGTKLGALGPIFPRADKGLAQIMADMEQEKTTPVGHANAAADTTTKQRSEFPATTLASEVVRSPREDFAPSDPGAGPRTMNFAEVNPGAQVAGSAAETTEREGTPSHHEAPTSGMFRAAAAQAAITAGTGEGAPGDASPQIAIDDFAKVELRVAKIVVAERIPKADKLLRLEVDLGHERRQILSGIAEWYTPEELIGRRIVVITNLAPRKMRGLESHGMLLAASAGENGKPVLATFPEGDAVPLGARLK